MILSLPDAAQLFSHATQGQQEDGRKQSNTKVRDTFQVLSGHKMMPRFEVCDESQWADSGRG